MEKANIRNNRIELHDYMDKLYIFRNQYSGTCYLGCKSNMKRLRIGLAKLLAGKENIIAPIVPTDRMRIVFLGQLSNGALYPEAYRVMMINSPNYKHD